MLETGSMALVESNIAAWHLPHVLARHGNDKVTWGNSVAVERSCAGE